MLGTGVIIGCEIVQSTLSDISLDMGAVGRGDLVGKEKYAMIELDIVNATLAVNMRPISNINGARL